MSLLSGASSQLGRTYSRVEAGLTKPYLYVPPRKLSTTLRFLDPSDSPDLLDYRKIARLFETSWKHQHKQLPRIKKIFAVSLPDHLNKSYDEYKGFLEARWNGVNEQLMFHGTTRGCSLGEEEQDITLCEEMTCSLCCILRTSFLVSMAGSARRGCNRFGSGIYTSSASSTADHYAIAPWLSDDKAIIVAKVALGKSSIHYRASENLTAPPWGYDSVIGKVGIDLNDDDQVVYRNEAIRPAYIVIYERPNSPSVTTVPRPAPKATRSNMTTKTKSSTSSRCTIM
ncbi:hypothetical protein M407DRAFT_23035 [Tulasnella calospora MUT 4182]|uniref:PARP catalytic domain-containing protein n=1 Tax=Tulasnella calospora MUT 4182 TaxID=1051891 RepID=A0A0C3QK86_9AGAM|nr:hypothetical protein M407DRAFT_23035 [Tulasnella calospora MUT 4182]